MIATMPARPAEDQWREIDDVYTAVTDGLRRPLRVSELVYAVAERFPGALPSRAAIDAERRLLQKDKQGLEIQQGEFIARVLAHPRLGAHLLHAMSQPTAAARERLDEFRCHGCLDLGPVRVERAGSLGQVTLQHHAVLNAEDDASTAALETAVDLVLLDDAITVGLLRGAPSTHPKYAGRRILGAGINLTELYCGRISLVEFMLERELGPVSKLYRGHDLNAFDSAAPEQRREKPWIAAAETFAIGGACQWLLVMDHVIADEEAYFSLPARKEGIIPGCANLRLPRLVGDRLARQAIFFNRSFRAAEPDGRLIADRVVPAAEVDAAICEVADELTASGTISVLANRRALRAAHEPLDVFRRYMSTYAREQAHCLYSSGLIKNLERNWTAKRRTIRADELAVRIGE
jgi:(3,5-dihydroxyphenyl)acetyl-CoA 1,2-dioxygenase